MANNSIPSIYQPDALRKNEPLVWAPGTGVETWDMFCAAAAGDLPSIKALLDKDPALVRCAWQYHVPMFFAVRNNQLEAASFLLANGANPVNSGTSDTLLTMARDRGYLEMERLLEAALADPWAPTSEGQLIAETIRSRDLARLKELLTGHSGMVHARDESTNQPIHWAVMTRQPDMIDQLLEHGADIDAKRADGARPVQLINGDYGFRGWTKDFPVTPMEVLTHLRSKGAYIDICTACAIGDIQRVSQLLDEDPSLANRVSDYVTYYIGSGTPIKNAAARGHTDIVRLLLERGADPNLPEEGIAPYGHALHSAVCNGHIAIVRLLLEHGAYPNVEIESSADTLSAAIARDNKPMIELLCSHGAASKLHLLAYYGDIRTAAAMFAADPSLADNTEAFENAAGEGHDAFVRLMLRYQPTLATRMAVGVQDQGPDHAIRSGELCEFLFQQGMDPNFRNWLGIMPLHRFAMKGDLQNAAIFIGHNADLHARDAEISSTPLAWALRRGHADVAELLKKRGAV
ncbi:MAG TPA: ankyrin repeat domain-containing protein [Puia sp.]|nr:ankyrin repeat domain-containing protein [Puia sp.]